MKSKKLAFVFFLAASLISALGFAQSYPKVSNSGKEYWYYIKFLRTNNVLEDEGTGNNCKTALAKVSKAESQLWKVVRINRKGKKQYKIISKAGGILYATAMSSNGLFKTAKANTGTYTFDIFTSANTSYGNGALEIAADSTLNQALNQVGSPKAGQEISFWAKADDNNVLKFIAADKMDFAYTMPELSTDSSSKYYYIQFQNGKYYLAGDPGAQANRCKVATLSDITSTNNLQNLLWKVWKGSDGKYYFQNKNKFGMSITTVDGVKYLNSNVNYTGFDIVESSNNLGGFEIGTSASGCNFINMYHGAKEGNFISLYTPGDNDNVVRFIPEDDIIPVSGATSYSPKNIYTLWYTSPGENWMTSCLPIGNGQFGATVMGQVRVDDIQFNDKTLWSGKVGKITDNASYGYYLNFGNLYIRSKGLRAVKDYVRYLDINDAVAGVEFTSDRVKYKRTYFVSYPDSCLVIHYAASQSGKINISLTLRDQNGGTTTVSRVNGPAMQFYGEIARKNDSGAAEPESYFCKALISLNDGKSIRSATITENTEDGTIEIHGADSVTIFLRGMTDFDPNADQYVSGASVLPKRVTSILEKASYKNNSRGYSSLLTDHKNDYHELFDRCKLTLGEARNGISTPALISAYANDQKNNLFLEELYFNYGRYLLISSSRGVSLPANLQGIWNNNNTPAWHSDIHSNINVQMNYWPAEPTNLSELHMPFLDYIYREACVKPSWRQNAQVMGKVDTGWTLPTENNIYGSGSNFASNYTIANAWYCQHLWQHYRYTMDTKYLRNEAFPAMKSCVEYWFKKLKKSEEDNTYECPNEWSPEHGLSEDATAHSQQLVWDLFNNTRKAIKILGKDAVSSTFRDSLESYFNALDDGCHTEINPDDNKTYLREWKYSSQFNNAGFVGTDEYKNHRHISHLMGLYPCDEIGEDINDSIFKAAKVSLIARGDGYGTGWSLGHKINLNARAYMGGHCHNLIKRALQQTWTTTTDQSKGGIYENLWDAHAPYQIDGNFGYTAGIAEMLLQSRFDKLEILPAIPTEYWKNGSVKGLKAVGNFTVDIEWADTVATKIDILSTSGTRCTVKYKDISKKYKVKDASGADIETEALNDNEISFLTSKGTSYMIRPIYVPAGISYGGKIKNQSR